MTVHDRVAEGIVEAKTGFVRNGDFHSRNGRAGNSEWCRLRDSNTRPRHYE